MTDRTRSSKLKPTTDGISSHNEEQTQQRFSLEAIRVENFKKIENTKIELGPITYLVGGNNSGKSSILQAVHTAVSCAQTSVELGEKVVAEAALRYSPIADFTLLGHRAPYTTNRKGLVEFEGFATGNHESVTYTIKMYKARNHNNVGVNRSGSYPGFGQVICDPHSLFSVYVPGLSGVPHREEMSGYASVFRKAASGEANLVFRNIIRLLKEKGLLEQLEKSVQGVLKIPVSFKVDYDSEKDLYVEVSLATGDNPLQGDYLPIDLWGTGLLQITQIFAYVILFKPKLLLVDEPDSHLHPSRQKNLAASLEEVSDKFECKVIVSTHSRHLITGASEKVKVIWLKDGKVESDTHRELATLLMDLGALDQLDRSPDIIFCTEDENPWALRQVITNISSNEDSIKIVSFNGVNNAITAQAYRSMADLMNGNPKIIVHRDRDCLTDKELEIWSKVFKDQSIKVFCPILCDSEAYYASAEHISEVLGMELKEARELRGEVVNKNFDHLYNKFEKKRKAVNMSKIYEDGGSPRNEELWAGRESIPEPLLYGKDLLNFVEQLLTERNRLERGAREKLRETPARSLVEELQAFLKVE